MSISRKASHSFWSLVLLLFVGGSFIAVGFFALNTTKIADGWSTVSGEVVGISTKKGAHRPIVQYTINEQEYSATGNVGTSLRPKVGTLRDVAYNPTNPQEAYVVGFGGLWPSAIFIALFPVIGVALLVIGVFSWVGELRRSREIQRLIAHGRKIQGMVASIEGDSHGLATQTILAIATDPIDSQVKKYTSDLLQGAEILIVRDFHKSPMSVDIYIDQLNPQRYYVDATKLRAN